MFSTIEYVFCSITSFFVALNFLLVSYANVRLHYRAHIGRWFCITCHLRNKFTTKRTNELIFPLLQSFIVVPLVQILCVWRIHQTATAAPSTILAWLMSLVTSSMCAVLSLSVYEYNTYFAHVANILQLPFAFLFMFESSLKPNPSGEISIACIYVICCVIPLIHPPRKLKTTQLPVVAPQSWTLSERRMESIPETAYEDDSTASEALASADERAIDATFGEYQNMKGGKPTYSAYPSPRAGSIGAKVGNAARKMAQRVQKNRRRAKNIDDAEDELYIEEVIRRSNQPATALIRSVTASPRLVKPPVPLNSAKIPALRAVEAQLAKEAQDKVATARGKPSTPPLAHFVIEYDDDVDEKDRLPVLEFDAPVPEKKD